MKTIPAGFIVVFEDNQGVCFPMGLDADCEGAIEAYGKATAFFASRESARKAIRISTANAKLMRAQEKPANEDFLGACLRCVKIVPLEMLA